MSDATYAPIGPTSIEGTPDQHFDTVLWTGDTKAKRIGGLNFQPDLVWIKNRTTGTDVHYWMDSVRGPDALVNPDRTGAEWYSANYFEGFNADGFNIGTTNTFNRSGNNFAAWCWKAGNGTVENSDGDLPTTISVNKEAGFSIISFDNRTTDLTNFTLGHGLDKAPEFVVVKNRGKVSQWATFHKHLADNYYVALNDSDAQASYSGYFPAGGMTSKTIKLGTDDDIAGQTNGPGIVYAWHSVEGFSKFGVFEGNSNADGPFIYLGFKPAMLICKNIDTGSNWTLWDNKRNPTNPCSKKVFPDHDTDPEHDGNPKVDFLSNGFKVRDNHVNINEDDTIIYMAWAEMPFKYATAR